MFNFGQIVSKFQFTVEPRFCQPSIWETPQFCQRKFPSIANLYFIQNPDFVTNPDIVNKSVLTKKLSKNRRSTVLIFKWKYDSNLNQLAQYSHLF